MRPYILVFYIMAHYTRSHLVFFLPPCGPSSGLRGFKVGQPWFNFDTMVTKSVAAAHLAAWAGHVVTDSARAHTYHSISIGMQIGEPPAVPFLAIPVYSMVFEIHVLVFQSASGTFWWSETRSPCFPRLPTTTSTCAPRRCCRRSSQLARPLFAALQST